ncbi:hypothetical protein KHS38_05270 [Mucilaginibacter sp. Bleaf8]|uniref:hypothetical protein n=1 Tax=Mucilaginibacter sp. Bleaf8 TaxID=2834430 RepID=UPI001BCEE687|nr:hypothetical protein [Mucilaginibacter sp. Bleaf8]MBS7563806.1 hypothetical protein [Mucilaginibacter sp. Bleaf8]
MKINKQLSISLTAITMLINLLMACQYNVGSKQKQKLQLRPAIQRIVDSMAKYNQVNSSGVGEAGVRTVQWTRYEQLSKTATLPELRALTNHKNPVVRCYALDALSARNDTATFSIVLAHLHDTARVSTFMGCIINSYLVGDYFLNAVIPYDSTSTGYRLTKHQKQIVDSILLYDKHMALSAKYNLLYDMNPQAKYYNRVKEIATLEKMPVAIWTLARYRKSSDIGIIRDAFNDNKDSRKEDYAIRAAIEMPDSSFYPKLTGIFEREWKEKLYDYGKWQVLYEALARYPDKAQTLQLFKRTLATKDEFRYKTLGTDLLIAITKYPNPLFEPLKRQIKLDKYSMEDVVRALNENE